MNASSRRYRTPRITSCLAILGASFVVTLVSAQADRPPAIPATLPPGTGVVKTYSPTSGDDASGDRDDQLLKASFQRSAEVTECIEEYTDGSKSVRYYLPPYLLMEHRVGPVLLDLRSEGGDGTGNIDYFEELRWLALNDVAWHREEDGDWIAERGELHVVIDGASGLPRLFSDPEIRIQYSVNRMPSNGVRIPEQLRSILGAYQTQQRRAPVYLRE